MSSDDWDIKLVARPVGAFDLAHIYVSSLRLAMGMGTNGKASESIQRGNILVIIDKYDTRIHMICLLSLRIFHTDCFRNAVF